MKKSFKISCKELSKQLIWFIVLTVGLILYSVRARGNWQISNNLFMAGLLFLIIGLFRLTRWLGLYDSTIYSYKRLWSSISRDKMTKDNAALYTENKMPSFSDYMANTVYEKPILESLIIGMASLAVSIVIMYAA